MLKSIILIKALKTEADKISKKKKKKVCCSIRLQVESVGYLVSTQTPAPGHLGFHLIIFASAISPSVK